MNLLFKDIKLIQKQHKWWLLLKVDNYLERNNPSQLYNIQKQDYQKASCRPQSRIVLGPTQIVLWSPSSDFLCHPQKAFDRTCKRLLIFICTWFAFLHLNKKHDNQSTQRCAKLTSTKMERSNNDDMPNSWKAASHSVNYSKQKSGNYNCAQEFQHRHFHEKNMEKQIMRVHSTMQ